MLSFFYDRMILYHLFVYFNDFILFLLLFNLLLRIYYLFFIIRPYLVLIGLLFVAHIVQR